MQAISPQLAACLPGSYREEICERLWAQVPAPLRLTVFDRDSTARHPGFSWHRSFVRLNLGPLPGPMQRELAWCFGARSS